MRSRLGVLQLKVVLLRTRCAIFLVAREREHFIARQWPFVDMIFSHISSIDATKMTLLEDMTSNEAEEERIPQPPLDQRVCSSRRWHHYVDSVQRLRFSAAARRLRHILSSRGVSLIVRLMATTTKRNMSVVVEQAAPTKSILSEYVRHSHLHTRRHNRFSSSLLVTSRCGLPTRIRR